MKKLFYLFSTACLVACNSSKEAPVSEETQGAFPYTVTEETPKRANLSSSIKRAFENYLSYRPEENPLFTTFKYTRLKGFDYPDDGTVSRRDPSKVIKVGDKYYIWYTKRHTKFAPIGAHRAAEATDEIPSTDWDLSEIWYATSEDGFTWKEEGVAVSRPPKPEAGFRSISTPDILVWKGRYYLYYQAFSEPSGLKGDYCPVSMAHADSPEGPWTYHKGEVIKRGKEGEWNQFAIHDPYPLVHNGKIYIYYKSAFNRPDHLWVGQGLCTSDSPEGPFVHHKNNPVLGSGHEFIAFPFNEGLAAICTTDGNERNTIQYAKDWVNFEIAANIEFPPVAAAPYVQDAYTDTKMGKGITWGVSHFTNAGKGKIKHSEIARFDCALTPKLGSKIFQTPRLYLDDDFYYNLSLSAQELREREKERD